MTKPAWQDGILIPDALQATIRVNSNLEAFKTDMWREFKKSSIFSSNGDFSSVSDCIQILGDKSCEVIFPKIARWILRVNGTTFISPSGWLLGAQCTSKNVVDWPLKMTQPFGTRYVYGWNIQIRSVWHCEGEEICIISGFLWGAHWGSQHLGLLHESIVIDWELPCISNLMKVRKTQWLSNKTRGINIPPFGSYLAKLQCSATVDNGRNLYIPAAVQIPSALTQRERWIQTRCSV